MKLVRYGGGRIGVMVGDGVADVTDVIASRARYQHPDLMRTLIHDFALLRDPIMAQAQRGATGSSPVLEAPLFEPSKIVAAAANYRKHTEEMTAVSGTGPRPIQAQGVFLKAPSSLVGPEAVVRLPYTDRRTDHEVELAVIVGSRCKDVPEDQALSHVFGYCCLIDVTVRGQEDRGVRKSFDTFTPIGPWIVTADEVPDPSDLELSLTVNGETRQRSSTAGMIYGVQRLIEYITAVMTLLPGDIIATGTPEGVGPLSPGDRVAVHIAGVGGMAVSVR